MRRISSTTGVLVLASVLCLVGSSDDATPRHHQPVAGIEVFEFDIGPDVIAIQEVSMAQSAASTLSVEHPNRFAYAYRDGDAVVLNAVERYADSSAALVEAVRREHPLVPIRIKYVEYSQRTLERMKHELVGPHPEEQVIRGVGPDAERNKVVIRVNDVNEAFAQRIARTYPVSAVAFEIVDWGPVGF